MKELKSRYMDACEIKIKDWVQVEVQPGVWVPKKVEKVTACGLVAGVKVARRFYFSDGTTKDYMRYQQVMRT